ncbi:tyrosine--tRNA ligase [Acetobacterium paludosum]|uniref:Tyrosine--tRNA ligase n=1 Tax=Acetobacterium paludosum TaxID=52693 RepID=A0A923I0B1_9FIRM|nr:tyrosine--tRNA ligase [Acetobacterium paludosum]MBC3889914.1 tyrosine--tRNA ligase [Acetobacterium paludosum]
MENVFQVLKERGFIEQCTHEEEIVKMLGEESVSFYIGFDPTADSLHIGHFIQIMVMAHMQQHGHRPIALIGGGTTMIGDPSGRTDMRQVMTPERIKENGEKFKKVFEKFLSFENDKAVMINNADWLLSLNYINFLRDIGSHFSVNRMLAADCYKTRLEKGLTFLEFNYQLLQAYDFYVLHREQGCKMQFGGNDQWSNIIAGVELVRRKDGEQVYGMTFSLLTTSEGIKMGKTAKGALWLDPEKTSPYEFYQYWRNIADMDVEKCLALLTFIPMDEVRRLGALEGAKINQAKEILAFAVTAMIHGEEAAHEAQNAARKLFAGNQGNAEIPSIELAKDELGEGMDILSLLEVAKLIPTRSEGRRLIKQGGIFVDGEKVLDPKAIYTASDFKAGKLILKKGKKAFKQINLV